MCDGMMTTRGWESALGRGRLSTSTGSVQACGGVVVNGGNEFPSQHMEVLRTGTGNGVRVEVSFRHGFASQRKALGRGRLSTSTLPAVAVQACGGVVVNGGNEFPSQHLEVPSD
jgi:predicted sugar kinase